jgi:hypothetical protein
VPQPKGRKWTKTRGKVEEATARILERRENGETFNAIGRAEEVSSKTAQGVCYRHKTVPLRPGKGRVNRKRGDRGLLYPEIVRLREEGHRGTEIAKRLGLKDAREVKDIVKYWRTDKAPDQRRHTKESLEARARKIIREAGRYVGGRELCQDMRISPSSLARHCVLVPDVNEKEGFKASYSVFQDHVEAILREIFPCVKKEHKFDDCLSPKGFLLRFDFYMKTANLLIEADGLQHEMGRYDDTGYFADAEYRKKCDDIKDEYAKKIGVRLVRIPYVGKVTRDYVEDFIGSSL